MVVNLQTTPLDDDCKLRMFAKCDDVSKMLMSKLGMEIPEFRLKRYTGIKTTSVMQGILNFGASLSFAHCIKMILL